MAFIGKDGEETEIKVPVGMSMLEAAHENDIDLEGKYISLLDNERYFFIWNLCR